jgi:hypothetical protein
MRRTPGVFLNNESRDEVLMLTATVSGSFHRHMGAITSAVHELAALSVRVLSPADPRIVAAQGEFLFVASDSIRSVRLVQDRHLDCIRGSNFLWLVCPEGYVGLSAAMEIGAARDAGVPIFSRHAPNDMTMREYVTVVPTMSEAVQRIRSTEVPKRFEGIFINPRASIQEIHGILERVDLMLSKDRGFGHPASQVYSDLEKVRTLVTMPRYMQ